MYKYIVYCSVSAAIIIASKYLYQHWIKQNHIISTLKQELAHLNDKVKRLESEMEKRAHVFSGGVQIPINFVKAATKTEGGNPKTIILLNEDISTTTSSSSSSSSSSSTAPSLPPRFSSSSPSPLPPPRPLPSPPASPLPRSSASSPPMQKSLDICDKLEVEEEEQKQKKLEKNDEEDTTVHSIISSSNRRKKKLPDAKLYTNGSKIKDENDQCEYLCVVGKRGGHSWKKI